MKKRKSLLFVVVISLVCLNGCSWFHRSKIVSESRPEAAKIKKAQAVTIAKEFAAKEGLGDEFRVNKPSRIERSLTLGKDPHWVWRIYFANNGQKLIKFYNKSPIMVELNAVTGAVENWGRR